jgi:hypothetical protein
LRNTGSQAITSSQCIYHWPDSRFHQLRGKITIKQSGKHYKKNSMESIRNVINWREGYGVLPSTYSSFIHMDLINRCRSKGRYFYSVTPDVYSGFVNAANVDSYIYSAQPFIVHGISGKSNGGMHFGGDLATRDHSYMTENDLPIHPGVEFNPLSLPLIVAEAFLQARDRNARLFALEWSLADVCKMALIDALDESYESIIASIGVMATSNGLHLNIPARPNMEFRLYSALRKWRARVARLAGGYRRWDCAKKAAFDIDAVCQLVGSVQRLENYEK